MRSAWLVVVLAFVLGAAHAHAEFYRWTDGDGREFFTNEKEKIPAEYRGSAKTVEVHDERVSIGEKQAAGGTRSGKVSEHKDKYGKGEEHWRKRAEKLRRQLRKEQDEYDLVVQQIEEREHPTSAGTPAQQKKKAAGLASLKKKKAQLEKKIARTKRELDVDLPEEARRADAYPGWVRE